MAPFYWPHVSQFPWPHVVRAASAGLCWTLKELSLHTRSCRPFMPHQVPASPSPPGGAGKTFSRKREQNIRPCTHAFLCLEPLYPADTAWRTVLFLHCTAGPGEMKRWAISYNRKAVVATCGIFNPQKSWPCRSLHFGSTCLNSVCSGNVGSILTPS